MRLRSAEPETASSKLGEVAERERGRDFAATPCEQRTSSSSGRMTASAAAFEPVTGTPRPSLRTA